MVQVLTRQRGNRDPIERNKPSVIIDYNHNMGGVDMSDMMLYAYLDERRTVKFWKKVVFSILNRMVTNSYIIYKENVKDLDETAMTRYSFYIKCIDSLSEEHLAVREQQQQATTSRRSGVATMPNNREKDCCVCSDRKTPGGRKRARTSCIKCDKGLHGTCQAKHKCKK